MGQKGQDTGGKKGAYRPEKRNRIESLRSRPYTNDNKLRKLEVRGILAENSWKNLMDKKVQRKLQGKKALIGWGISELGVLESHMEHGEYCYQTKSFITPQPLKKKIEKNRKKSKKIEGSKSSEKRKFMKKCESANFRLSHEERSGVMRYIHLF